jgi:hypothetical protein
MCYAELIVESKRASRGVTPLAHEQPYGPHLYLRSNSPFPETRIKSVERRLADNETMNGKGRRRPGPGPRGAVRVR